MRLSTSTNIMDRYNKVQGAVPMEDCIRRCAAAGYQVLDMNFHDMSNPGQPVSLDGWQAWVERMGALAASLGVSFSQSHAHFYHFCSKRITDEERIWHDELVRRSLIGSGMLGARWVVVHAATDRSQGYSVKRSQQRTYEYFAPLVETAKKQGVGLAIENLYDPLNTFSRTYSAAPEELIELVDRFNDPDVAICWDFGHANLSDIDQNDSLRLLGKRLQAVHINDNHGEKDNHLLPYHGNIDWETIASTLKEIGYQNDFTFEITPFADRVPPVLRDTLLRHTVEVGESLVKLIRGEPEAEEEI